MKKILFLILIFLLVISSTVHGNSVDSHNLRAYNRILFLIDCSNSMNYHDENKLVIEIMKMFVDGAHSSKTDIGFITYNDRILKSHPLTSVKQSGERGSIKEEIDRITRRGSADIGLALNSGMDMFIENPLENSKPAIVLISDGETDLRTSTSGRTMADSLADENSAYEKSKQIDCPVYTVGISRDGSLNTEYLNKIATNTGGKKYEIQNSSELLSVFNTLFTDVTGINVVTKDTLSGTGASQVMSIDIPAHYTEETNIILQHKTELGNINIENGTAEIYKSKNFASIKLINPAENVIKLNFTADFGDEVKINIANFLNVYPKITVSENLSAAEVPIEAKLYNIDTGSPLNESAAYENVTAELIITDDGQEEPVVIPMEVEENKFKAVYKNNAPKQTELQIKVHNQVYTAESEISKVAFTNTSPEQTGTIEKLLLRKNKSKEFNLDDYFSDADNDPLHYEVVNHTEEASEALIDENILMIKTISEGTENLAVRVTDSRGGVLVKNFDFSILPFWIYYKHVIIGIGCIFILLLILYLIYRLKTRSMSAPVLLPNSPGTRFNGARFEGYFLNTVSGNEIPVLIWNSSYIENERIVSLGNLLAIMDVPERIPEAHKIYLEAGNNNTVIFYHKTDCIVSLGKRNIPQGKKEILNYDDKLYIIFEDHVTEMELKYKRMRKMVSA